MKKLIGLLGLCVILSGCGLVRAYQTAHDVDQSRAEYKACLSSHPGDLASCATQKAAYEADLQAYDALSNRMRSGNSNSAGYSAPSHCQSVATGPFVNTNCY